MGKTAFLYPGQGSQRVGMGADLLEARPELIESCFAAAVNPWRATGEVPDEQALAVVGFAREQMAVSAREGHISRPGAVYRRAGRPCPRCGAIIRRREQGDQSRVTFWCPGCQL